MRRGTVAAVVGLIATAAVVLALGAGPGTDDADGGVPVGSLSEVLGAWESGDGGRPPTALVAPVRLAVVPGGLFVETGCNTGRGPAHVEESRLVIEALATTRRACPPALEAQERWVLDMLDSRPRMERSGGTLTLHWGEGERYALVFRLLEQTPTDGTEPSVPTV